MKEPTLSNRIRAHREELGLSQHQLGELVGVSRQAIIAIEAGRQVPSTSLGLRLARALRCAVEDLFSLAATEGLPARLAPPLHPSVGAGGEIGGRASRVVVSEIGGKWVAHRLAADPTVAADGIVEASVGARTGVVRPLGDVGELRRNVIVSGCAPVLGALTERVGRRFIDARATWLPASSLRSLELLRAGLIHVAGIHFARETGGEDNVDVIRALFPDERMLVVNLTRWRQGFVVAPGDPLGIRDGASVMRPGLRIARREEGSSADKLLATFVARDGAVAHAAGGDPTRPGPSAAGHVEVADLVRCGAADVGVAIESVALAAGLGFVPLTEERFDLVVPAALAETTPVARLLEELGGRAFKAEMAHLPGYDAELVGHVTTVEAA